MDLGQWLHVSKLDVLGVIATMLVLPAACVGQDPGDSSTPSVATSPSAFASPSPASVATPRATPRQTVLPTPTLAFDPNSPLPITWGQIEVPAVPAPWTVGDAVSEGSETITVFRSGSAVGYVRVTVHLPEAYPGRDIRSGRFAALRQLAQDDLQSFVDDRSAADSPVRAIPEPIREVPVAGGSGVRIAFSDIDVASGSAIARYVFVYHWDGRAVWTFQTAWPPDEELARSAFTTLAGQQAFDPQLEALVAGLRLPAVLPSPEPF